MVARCLPPARVLQGRSLQAASRAALCPAPDRHHAAAGAQVVCQSSTVSAQYSTEKHDARNVLDGNVDTFWQSAATKVTNQWISFDLAVQVSLSHVDFYGRSPGNPSFPKNIRIESSSDGKRKCHGPWTVVQRCTSPNDDASGDVYTCSMPAASTSRYWKTHFENNHGNQ